MFELGFDMVLLAPVLTAELTENAWRVAFASWYTRWPHRLGWRSEPCPRRMQIHNNPFLMSLNLKNILNRFKPSGEGQEASDDPGVTSTDIPENILAFRTITTLLAQIPRTTPLETIDYLEGHIENKLDHQILKISDAFAHIAAVNNVTAVMTNHVSHDSNSQDLTILATSSPVAAESQPTISTQPKGLLGQLSFLWTQNPRHNNAKPVSETTIISSSSPPKIISPKEPPDWCNQTAYQYLCALEEHWWMQRNNLIAIHAHIP